MPAAPTPHDEQDRLRALRDLGVLDTPPEDRFDRLTAAAVAALGAPMAAVSLVDTDRQWFKSSVGLEVTETPRDVAFCAYGILAGEPLVVEDATEDPRFADNPLVTGALGVRAYAGVPLESPSGERLGMLCVIDRRRRTFTDDQIELLRQLAGWATQELHSVSREDAVELLEATERAYRRQVAVIEASTDFIGMAGPDGRVIHLNPAGRRMVGLAEDVDETTLAIPDFHPPRVAARILEEAIPVAAAEGSWEGESVLLGPEGREIPVSQVVIAHRSEDGSIEFFSTVARDISHRDEIRRLREVQEIKDQLVATVSHELRTPLTSINGSLGLLASGVLGDLGNLSDEAAELVQIAYGNSERLIRLVSDLLDLQKMTRAEVELRLADVHPRDIVDGAIHSTGGMAATRGVRILWRMSLGEEVRVTCDPDAMVQVVTNLLGNAVKFSPDGAEVEVVVALADPGTLRIEVRDHGPGITEADLAHVFDPFWQADSSSTRRVGGTGLGLAVASTIVQQHEGSIEVDSEPGLGSTFRVDLPLAGPRRDD